MCRSPSSGRRASSAESLGSSGDESPAHAFSFGTTHPLQLPAVLTQSPPCPAVDSEALDDEFTFGTTKPIELPDLTHAATEIVHTGHSQVSVAAVESGSLCCSPSKALAVQMAGTPPSPSLQTPSTNGYELQFASPDSAQMRGMSQFYGHRSPEAFSPWMPSQVGAHHSLPAPIMMQAARGYSIASGLVYAQDGWAKPAPMQMSLALSPYALPTMEEAQEYPAGKAGAPLFRPNSDTMQSVDLEPGGCEAAGDDSLGIPELTSRSSWSLPGGLSLKIEKCFGVSPSRRVVGAVCMVFVLSCIAVLVAIVCVDPGGSR